MINRAILEAQKQLYVSGQQRAIAEVERLAAARVHAIGEANLFTGSLEAIDGLLSLLDQFEVAQTEQPEGNKTNKEESNVTAIAAN